MAGNVISLVTGACVCGWLLCVRSLPAVVRSRRVAACVGCSLAAFHGAAVISPAAAAGRVFLYLVVNSHVTVLVLDDTVSSVVTFNLKLLKQPEVLWSPCKDLNLKTRVLKRSDIFLWGVKQGYSAAALAWTFTFIAPFAPLLCHIHRSTYLLYWSTGDAESTNVYQVKKSPG